MKKGEYTIPRVKLNKDSHKNLAKVLKEKGRGLIEELGDFKLGTIHIPTGGRANIIRFEASKAFKGLMK